MVKLIIGGTGSGKTKEMIEKVNAAVQEEKGSVVCVSKGNKLTFDISHGARLIDTNDYVINNYDGLLGFLCGIHAGNYDISSIFIDGLHRVAKSKDPTQTEVFLNDLDTFAQKHSVKFTVSLSEETSSVTEGMKKFL